MEAAHVSTPRRFFGDYELLEEVARGGMGVIYRARQLSLDRTVAVKMINTDGLRSASARMRFEVETGAIASLEHPNIVSLYESGEHDGQLFYSMRYITGGHLLDLLQQPNFRLKDRVRLLEKVSRAVQHAHASGVLHRDLKPSNILIDENGEPQLADFGLAKRDADGLELTQTESVLGSPNYMAPEQAQQSSKVTTAADVYSLGAILYQILTGKPPFFADTPLETMRRVIDMEPTPPSQIRPSDRDLEVVCLKSLEKLPARRYRSASSFADELSRWLSGQAVEARPVGTIERGIRWARRQPALAASLAASAFLLIAATVISSVSAYRINEARADTAETLYQMQLEKADELHLNEQSGEAMALLAKLSRNRPGDEVLLQRLANGLRYRSVPVLAAPPVSVASADILSYQFVDSDRIQIVDSKGCISLFNQDNGKTLQEIFHFHTQPKYAAISSESLNTAVAMPDGTIAVFGKDGKALCPPLAHQGEIYSMVINAQGTRVASSSNLGLTFTLWDTQDGTKVLETERWGKGGVYAPEFSDDGKLIVAVSARAGGRLWDAETGELLQEFPSPKDDYNDLEFTPDNRLIAFSAANGATAIWDVETGKQLERRFDHRYRTNGIRIHDDGKRAVSYSADTTAIIWEIGSDAPPITLQHSDFVSHAAFSPDGTKVITGCHDGTAQLWDVATGRLLAEPMIHQAGVFSVAFGETPGELHTCSYDGVVSKWKVDGALCEPQVFNVRALLGAIATSSDGSLVAIGTREREEIHANMVRVIDPRTGEMIGKSIPCGTVVEHLAFSWDDRFLLMAGGQRLEIWNRASKTLERLVQFETEVDDMTVSKFEDSIVIALRSQSGWKGSISGDLSPAVPVDGRYSRTRFSPDGKILVCSKAGNGESEIWDTDSGEMLGTAEGNALVMGFGLGSRLVAISAGFSAYLWDSEERDYVLGRINHLSKVTNMAISPDGQWVASGSTDHTVQVWRIQPGQIISAHQLLHEGPVTSLAFDLTSRYLATGSKDHTARLWDVKTGHPLTENLWHQSPVRKVLIDPDGHWLLTATESGIVSSWPLHALPNNAIEWLPDFIEYLTRLRADDLGKSRALTGTDLTERALSLRQAMIQMPNEPLLQRYGIGLVR